MFACDRRTISDKAFRNVISNKQAETARLHSEITRLRHHLQLVSNADSQQQQQQGPSEQEAAAAPDPAAREAVLVSAIAAKDKPMAVVAQLERCGSSVASQALQLLRIAHL